MKIYTKRGDLGKTSLLGGVEVEKDSALIEAIGTFDELNAAIGVAKSVQRSSKMNLILDRIQKELFQICSALLVICHPDSIPVASDCPVDHTMKTKPAFFSDKIDILEKEIDDASSQLLQITEFVIPGESSKSAQLHVARTICRKAERRTISALKVANIPLADQTILVYLNRLSDWLFLMARKSEAEK